jgi:hypothetical protein
VAVVEEREPEEEMTECQEWVVCDSVFSRIRE